MLIYQKNIFNNIQLIVNKILYIYLYLKQQTYFQLVNIIDLQFIKNCLIFY